MTVSWDDYRILDATARSLSFQAAARELGVATSTVSRRIAALERRLGARLLERRPHGVALTAAGRLLASTASNVQSELDRVEHGVSKLDNGLSGRVRVTVGEAYGEALVPLIAEFRLRYPQIDVELTLDARVYDLARGEADLAIRMPRPKPRGLTTRKLGYVQFGLFASSDYLRLRGAPRSVEELDAHDFVGHAQDSQAPGRRLLESLAIRRFAVRVNSTSLTRLAVSSHLGIGVLEVHTEGLPRVLPELHTDAFDVWLTRHPSTRGVRRVDCLAAFLYERAAPYRQVPR